MLLIMMRYQLFELSLVPGQTITEASGFEIQVNIDSENYTTTGSAQAIDR